MNWQELSFKDVVDGRTADNVPYLKLFLIDYSREFKEDNINASCEACLREYYNKYLKKNKAKT